MNHLCWLPQSIVTLYQKTFEFASGTFNIMCQLITMVLKYLCNTSNVFVSLYCWARMYTFFASRNIKQTDSENSIEWEWCPVVLDLDSICKPCWYTWGGWVDRKKQFRIPFVGSSWVFTIYYLPRGQLAPSSPHSYDYPNSMPLQMLYTLTCDHLVFRYILLSFWTLLNWKSSPESNVNRVAH